MHDTMAHGLNGCLIKLFKHPLDDILIAANVTLYDCRRLADNRRAARWPIRVIEPAMRVLSPECAADDLMIW